MSFEKFSRSYFGENYEKVKKNYETGVALEKLSFQRKYPGADTKNFVFDVDLSESGNVRRTFTRYRNENGELFEITGVLFERFYAKKLYWLPRMWSPNGIVQHFVMNVEPLPFSVTKLKIHVNEEESFLSIFEPLQTSWKGTAKDITKVAVNRDDPYFASLLAACIISHVGGISRKHPVETEGTPKVVTSMARYFVYYSMKRFTEDPRKMVPYVTGEMKNPGENKSLAQGAVWQKD